MKRQIFTLVMALVLALGTAALVAQTPSSTMPSDQKVDQSGQPETGPGPDVDVDTGKNAAGAVDVDVNSTTDPDTAASGVDETGSLDNEANTSNLPATGSELPLLGLLGLASLAGAVALRSNR